MFAARALWVSLALMVFARGVLTFIPSMAAWGLNVQRFLDPTSGWGLWGLAALALIPAVARRGVPALEKAGDRLAHWRRAYAVVWLLGAALVWLMPDRVWFVGDFLIRMGNVESGSLRTSYVHALPLDLWLHGPLLAWGRGSAESATLALRLLGAIEAGLLAVLSVALARALHLSGVFAALAAGIVFFGGYLTMFTGLGKPASELCLATVAMAVFGVRAIEKRSSLLPCGLVMGAALLLHRSSVMLIPVWLLLVAWSGAWRRPAGVLGIVVPVIAAFYAIPRILEIATGYDLTHHWAGFSWRRLLDLVNLVIALSPLAIAIPLLLVLRRGGTWRRKDGRVLLVIALSFMPALLFVAPQQGIFRDWDVFAPAAVALSMLAAWLVVETVVAAPSRTWLAVPALALVILSALQWLAINRNEQRGLARVRSYLLEPPGPSPAERALGWDFLTSRNMRLQNWTEAADAASHAAADAPHRRVLLTWALAATMGDDDRTAASVYRQLLDREPEDPLGWLGLAGAAWRLGDRAELERAVGKMRTYSADGPEMATIRRHLTYYPKVWSAPDTVNGWSPR